MPSQQDITYETPEYPRQIRLDSTTFCNASCLSCHRVLTERKGEMDNDLLNTLLKDIAQWTPESYLKPQGRGGFTREIVPVNYGEFFLRKDWFNILSKIYRVLPYMPIVIPTNGSLMDDDTVAKLCSIPSVRVLNFSVNAYFDETYEKFMGLKADNIVKIQKAIAQIKVIRPDITLWASMVFDPQYCSDLQRDAFIGYWKELAEPQLLPAASAGRGTQIQIPRVIPCGSIFSDIVIGYDGKISSCCWDADFSAYNLGFYSGNLLNDWHSKQFQEFRKIHNEKRRQEIPLCKDCTYE